MLNGRSILLILLCALFIPSTGLSQMEPSQSEILNAVNKVDKDVAVLSQKMEGVESRLDQKIDLSIKAVEDTLGERLNGIDDEIKRINGDIKDLKGTLSRIWIGILLLIIGSVVIPIGRYFVKQWWENRDNKGNVNRETSIQAQATGMSEDEATPTQATQENVSEETSVKSQQEYFPSGVKLANYLKSEEHSKKRKV